MVTTSASFCAFSARSFVTVMLDTEHAVTRCRDLSLRSHSRSSAARIAQVEDPDGSQKKEKLSVRTKDSILWQMETQGR